MLVALFREMKMQKTLVAAALFVIGIATGAQAFPATNLGEPGSRVPFPGPNDFYNWTVPLFGVEVGDILAEVILEVPAGGETLAVVEAFGGCGSDPWRSEYSLSFGGVATAWNANQSDYCEYHIHNGQFLPAGDVTLKIQFAGASGYDFTGDEVADLRFGGANTLVAIPVPSAATGMIGGMAMLGAVGARRRRRRSEAGAATG